ncbi:hypothetical protein NJF44_04010 [Pseudomonas guariconensis]|uniref:hypothetical protein n=1 Tax=Pseudomonas TaxID=286 RepID=UPI002097CCE4|nr:MULTISPECIES: hypothetical protein [Pseudomonas]MCO7639650.1 hypothetical protein [Pseudomonas sp. S 311-6]MCO7514346.1 hypothetical protein [Pseudomonas putida]MCO7565208.1 hypothetical protein [Pseudomonas mosselii]MCO7593550.1 hypothetical protein [Pseudomonas guariconensis]MCO7604399.1 hypothetical protein [Pseudomonas guariconensis]
MAAGSDFGAFMARYFPTFLLGFFASLLSVALAVTLWVDSHWRDHPDNASYSVLLSGGLVLVLCLGHFLMIRGQGWAVRVVVGVLVISLLMALSLFGGAVPALLLAISAALPLLALLVLNGKRHREMRAKLVALRQERRR